MCLQKLEYSKEQREVAELLHPMLVDLLTDHKLGICFRDKSFGLSNESVNSFSFLCVPLRVLFFSFFWMGFACLFKFLF